MSQQGVKTSFAPIVRAVLDRIREVLGWDDDDKAHRVKLARINQVPRWDDDDVVVRITGARPLPGFQEGHGVIASGLTRGVIVEIRSRSTLDESDRVDIWLLDIQTPREDLILTGLCGLRVVDPDAADPDDPDVLTIDEVYLANSHDYRDELDKLPSPDASYGQSVLVFGVDYNPLTPDLPEAE